MIPPCREGKTHLFRSTSFHCDMTLCGDHAGITCDNCNLSADYIYDAVLYATILAKFTVLDEEEED